MNLCRDSIGEGDMLRIAVVDDDDKFRDQIVGFITEYFDNAANLFNVKCFSSGVDFLTEYKCNYDLVIMDIQMPMMNGMEVAHKLRKIDASVTLMFVTETANYAIKGYEVAALDYVLKPLTYETDFKYKFDRAVKQISYTKPRGKDLVVNDDSGKIVKLNLDQLIYVMKDRDTALYHTTQGVFRKRIPLFKVEESLRGERFAVANSGCLVNLSFVKNADGNILELTNNDVIVISRGKKKSFYEQFFDYIDNNGNK